MKKLLLHDVPDGSGYISNERDANLLYDEFWKWVTNRKLKQVEVFTNRDLSKVPHLYGEDFYISSIIAYLGTKGMTVRTSVVEKDGAPFSSSSKSSLVILHNVKPSLLHELSGGKILSPVYFIWNKTLPISTNLRILLGPLFFQRKVSAFVVASRHMAKMLKVLGVARRRVIVVPVLYKCPNCSERGRIENPKTTDHHASGFLKAIYIGSLNEKRFSLARAVDKLSYSYNSPKIELSIYTTSKVENKSFFKERRNLEVKIFHGTISDKEKCQLLSESDIFVAPSSHTTMEPPISVIEAKYHGCKILKP